MATTSSLIEMLQQLNIKIASLQIQLRSIYLSQLKGGNLDGKAFITVLDSFDESFKSDLSDSEFDKLFSEQITKDIDSIKDIVKSIDRAKGGKESTESEK